jgi:diaminopimelate decarboxylase/aspartate kinase
MSHQWNVMKFGGTSVTGRPQWETIANLVAGRVDSGRRVMLVFSAMAGVTDSLMSLARTSGDAVTEGFADLAERHRHLAIDLDIDATELLDEWCRKFHQASAIANAHQRVAETAWLGEWILTRIGCCYLEKTQDAVWVDARDALTAVSDPLDSEQRSWLGAQCEAVTDPSLAQRWGALAPVLVTQGFVARSVAGDTVLLGRGGSDTSAALLASRLGAAGCEIWTDVPGMFSADPRLIPAARLLRRLGYSEALEMAAGGARVIHPRCIRAAADACIPLEIRDLGNPALPGTRIGADQVENAVPGGIKAVVCQNDMVVLLLENRDIRQQVGFLAWVFTQISETGISVDQVATSETTTTVAINRAINHLDETALQSLVERLSLRCRVTTHADCSCINLVGRGARLGLERLGSGSALFRDRPLLMLSKSANDLCISLLVEASHANLLMEQIHTAVITADTDNAADSVFGAGRPDTREAKG